MTTIKYGDLEGVGVLFDGWEAWQLSTNGVWHEINAADAACKARVLTKEDFDRSFGDVPPLPIAAFADDATNGWRSPLV